eukprot:364991-Chlamydomonas_euryale.AAC.3
MAKISGVGDHRCCCFRSVTVIVTGNGPMMGVPELSAARRKGSNSGLGPVTKGMPMRAFLNHPIPAHRQPRRKNRAEICNITIPPHGTRLAIPVVTHVKTWTLWGRYAPHFRPAASMLRVTMRDLYATGSCLRQNFSIAFYCCNAQDRAQ